MKHTIKRSSQIVSKNNIFITLFVLVPDEYNPRLSAPLKVGDTRKN